ncbi:MAG TPA: 4-hydroxy-tetrahydrodipicolinate synthase [Terriglobia bacterium]|nr:4-hydroxy-tetrahydrodipicolinate synthase [Terriglobia bacterium]
MDNLGKLLGRIIIPMVTPFKRDNGDIDYPAAADLIEHLISHNYCDSLLIEGTTGEFNTQRFEERVELLKFARQAVAGRRPMAAGTGAASTREAVLLTQEAEKLGYDAALIIAPYFCRPTQEGIYAHYKTISQSTRLPIMLYNIPLFTGVNINPDTVGRLARDCKNIVGIKDEAGLNPTQMTEYARAAPEGFTIYDGDDIMVLCGLAQGAVGVVSGGAHVIGDKMRKMIELFLEGKIKEAEKIHKALDAFFKSFVPTGGVNPIPALRAAIELAGVRVGPPRLPLAESTEEEKERVRKQLVNLGVIK